MLGFLVGAEPHPMLIYCTPTGGVCPQCLSYPRNSLNIVAQHALQTGAAGDTYLRWCEPGYPAIILRYNEAC